MADVIVVICVAFDNRACAVGLAKFKDSIERCPFVDTALEVAGPFDLIVQGRFASLAEYTEKLDRVRGQLAEFVTRLETSFVSRKIERKHESEEAHVLWLPCENGMKRVDALSIDKITAEGDYMRVHVGNWNCLVHQTMHRLSDQLGSAGFIKLHRSAMVRDGFIERLVHDEHWRWKAHLRDGTQLRVAKGHVKDVLRLITGDSSKEDAASSAIGHLTEKSGTVDEFRMKASV